MLEQKVIASAASALVLAVVGLLAAFGLNVSQDTQDTILAGSAALAPVVAFIGGYFARHTPRPDLGGNL